MQITDGWVFHDQVTGLTLAATKGKRLYRLCITGVPGCGPRDFFFNLDGEFDGTGSMVSETPAAPPEEVE